ncbi:MAG: DUF2330 domain-containing protein [Alphaproteobacteria bacterium]|nr:DUF2330 domain-containing protein [Alphaproteobacteria bacterium]
MRNRALALAALLCISPVAANAFCGFYVAKADTKLFNKSSKVVLASHDNKHVITMVNDFQGDLKEFGVVIPVPTKIEKEQIHVTENKYVEHLDAYSAPRLVEYFDENPCERRMYKTMAPMAAMESAGNAKRDAARDKALGVKIEAEYTVGEYDIVILSAEQSGGLLTWLTENGYKVPDGAEDVLGSYIKQDMKFFLAKVNLKEQGKLGYTYLRPLQVAYESQKFMLPIRLGTVNANGPQELFIMLLTRNGRAETTNYRTVKIPTGMDIPLYVKDDFASFYKSMFDEQVKKEGMKAVFLEYAWDMGWCDPCAADPLSAEELRELGVFWQKDDGNGPVIRPGGGFPKPNPTFMPRQTGAQDVFVTRLHVRYDAKNFPEDLMFQETQNKENFQGRYVLRHPFTGSAQCEEMRQYETSLPARFEKEAQNLAQLTGWEISEIRKKMENKGQKPSTSSSGSKWWKDLWK